MTQWNRLENTKYKEHEGEVCISPLEEDPKVWFPDWETLEDIYDDLPNPARKDDVEQESLLKPDEAEVLAKFYDDSDEFNCRLKNGSLLKRDEIAGERLKRDEIAGKRLYTLEEIDFILENYEDLECSEIAEKLDRTPIGVRKKISRLGLEKAPEWTELERKFLRENYEDMTHLEMAEELGRSKRAVGVKCSELGLKKYSKWTEPEIEHLKSQYSRKTAKEIAEQLDRSVDSIEGMVKRLGLSKSTRRFTNEEVMELHSKGLNDSEIADRLGVTKKTIRNRREERGLEPNWP